MIAAAVLLLATLSPKPQSSGPIDPSLYAGLQWRNLGPFRGGRIAAVSGAIGQPGVFYAGLPLGGVWKTTSAGVTWTPIFDSIKEASSVGAVEVAPSDPNVIYVGMGDMISGGGINEGNGVYKSTDAGKTWEHLGLDETKQIPSILVDPHDPNIVMVAAQGNVRQESDNRGLYRSTDGGKTWKKTLFVDKQTGVQKITWAFDHPNVMLATTVRHYNAGGGGRGGFGAPTDGPTGTILFKSTDEGVTWKEVKGTGLPRLSGRTGAAIAMNTNSQRMFIVGNFGLYRSDDGGENWRQMDATDRRVSNGQGGYNCGVYVDSKDPDTVFVVNTCSYKSTDGGKSFTGFKGAPGGDDPQQFWFDPTDHNRIFLGSDQGATVSLDGGLSWSSWYNQSTAQVYHISVDNSFPYWVYATQQDSGAVATRSRGDLGEITPLDWLPTPGYEFGSIVADPRDPRIVYSGGPAGGIVKITYPSGQWINVSPNLNSSLRLRKVSNQPLIWNPTNSKELMTGFQFLMSTTDGGAHWKELSPDLGYPKGVKPPEPPKTPARPGGITPPPGGSLAQTSKDADEVDDDDDNMDSEDREQQPGPQGGSIESISPSSIDANVIWVGTSNGLIKLTKDHAKTWEDVTIPGLKNPTRADMSAIDASHQDPATAYVAIDTHGTGDLTPHFYRTHDFGKTWKEIVKGLPTDLPSGCFSRVIRADTKRPGLLFAGTESYMYVSFNDGDEWQSLAQNLPNTSYRDIVIKDNDLVVGTYGRGFWVLDDISPLRDLTASVASEPAHLFKPGSAIRVRRNINGDTPFPPEIPHALNPPDGAILYYYLGAKPSASISLDVKDSAGNLVHHMTSDPIAPTDEPAAPVPDFWLEKLHPLPTEIGTNRVNWNLRYDNPPTFSHSYEINANPGQTPPSPEGPLVLPGDYTVVLTVNGKSYSEKVTVRNDPRSPANGGALRAQSAMQLRLYRGIQRSWDAYQAAVALKKTITDEIGKSPADDLDKAVTDFQAKITAIAGSNGGGRRGFGGGRGGGPAAAPTFASVNSALVRQLNNLDSGDMSPSEPTVKSFEIANKELLATVASWNALVAKDLPAFNAVLSKHNLKVISASAFVMPQ